MSVRKTVRPRVRESMKAKDKNDFKWLTQKVQLHFIIPENVIIYIQRHLTSSVQSVKQNKTPITLLSRIGSSASRPNTNFIPISSIVLNSRNFLLLDVLLHKSSIYQRIITLFSTVYSRDHNAVGLPMATKIVNFSKNWQLLAIRIW